VAPQQEELTVSGTDANSGGKDQSKGTIGVLGAMAIGIGGMVGGGIFAVLGEAVSLAHGATAIAFAIAGIVALLTSYSYSKLSVRYQNEGGTMVFIDKAFGVDVATGSLNIILWLSYLVTLSLYAVAFGSYAMTFFSDGGHTWLRHGMISIAILLPVGINLLNAGIVSKTETFVVGLKLILLAVVIGAGFFYLDASRLAPNRWVAPDPLIVAAMVIFVAFEGFELIANSANDVRTPEKTLPRAFYGSVVLVIVLYVLVAVVTVGAVSEDVIAKAKDYALAAAAKPSLGSLGFKIVAISALLATFSAINATVYGNARLGFMLAKDGELPTILDRKAWNEPAWGVVIVGGLSLLMANLIDLQAIAIISSAGFLLVFAAANAAGFRLAGETGGNRWVSLVGAIACVASLAILLVNRYQESARAVWVFLGFVGAALVFELSYGKLYRGSFRLHSRAKRSGNPDGQKKA